ncbi:MAG TPA: right-handed parallel beta-helix repeat-containing protein [Thermoanaerobaculia bacterium]|nr:right-handed parallel beta-helix repeat-containing protein [Thermoanaerobaculia bacterium]
MRLLTAVIASLALASTASAATYYVSPTGSDSNSGSISAPFRTISKGAGVARPGDVVLVRGGVYYEVVKASVKGTATARISLEAYPGEKPVIDGSNSSSNTDLVQLGSAEYLDFKGFEVRHATRLGIAGWGASNVRIVNNTILGSRRGGIYLGYSSFGKAYELTIAGNTVYNNVRENELHNMNGGWGQSISVQYADGVTITGNRVYENDGEGIAIVGSDNALVQGNEIYDNFSVGIYLDNAQSTTIDGNLVHSTGNTRYFRDGYPAAGIGMANEFYSTQNPLTDNRIMNNIVVDTRWGIYYGAYEYGGGLKNTLVSNNTFHQAHTAMIWIESDAHSGTIVQNNVFSQSGGGLMHTGTTSGLIFRHNNWYGGNAGAAAGERDVIGNPLFANAGGRRAEDYSLAAFSPAIHTGFDVALVEKDFWGGTRTPAYDIGAHEASLPLGSSSPAQPALEPPDGVTAAVQSGSISLIWNAVHGVAGYRVYRDRALAATVTAPGWTDTGVHPVTSYSYAVTTIDGAGNESAPSVTVYATTPPARESEPPTVPGNLTAAADGRGRVVLTWEVSQDNAGVAGYVVYRNGVHVATVQTTSWTDTAVAASTTYVYEVQAFDHAGNYSGRARSTVTTPGNGRGRAVGRS